MKISALAALLVAACQGPDEYFWGSFPDAGGFDGPPLAGHGGSTTGTGGTVTGTGGMPTGLGGTPAGTAGTTGSAGSVGTGNAGTGGTPAGTAGTTGSAGATGRGGTTGSAGASGMAGTFGRGGATGTGGATGIAGSFGGGGTTGSAGATGAAGTVGRGGTTGAAGTTGRGGTTGSAGTTGTAGASGTVLYSEDFESESIGATAATDWSRTGGSSSDWTIATDGTKVFAQTGATSSTIRIEALTGAGASGSPWSGALSVSARVKLLMPGSSNQAALLCVRYNDTSNRYCAALLPNGVQIQTAVGGSTGGSAVFTATVTTGTFYDLRLSVDASNVLTVSLGGTQRGTYMPGAMTNGTVAIGTTSMEAAFDSIAVTRP
jgi:collagen type VII alpha